jgi:hypothetical protein
MSNLEHTMELKIEDGRYKFIYKENGKENNFMQFGYLKGESKWAKILKPNQYDNYAVDVYTDLDHIKEIAGEIAETAKGLIEDAGKKVKGIADLVKENDEDVEYVQFKRKGLKFDGSPNTPPKIYDASGTHVEDWDKLIGNGSIVKVAYQLSPYYMASTKMVGVSYKFYAIQIIKLSEYKAGGSGNAGFEDETDGDAPFDTDNEDF